MKHTVAIAAAAATAVALSLTACSAGGSSASGDKGGAAGVKDLYKPMRVGWGTTHKGGTVDVLMSSDFITLDPGNSNYVQTANAGQLYYRTLTMAKETAGQPPKIVPDLATGLGTPSKDGMTWTYHLKSGLKFEDGTPITAYDVKYGVERTFARDVYTQAPQELDSALAAADYKGPYTDGDTNAIQTPNSTTIVFHLNAPNPDFPALVSRSNTAPVPKAKDTKLNYTNHPISSGPYKVQSYERGRQLVLVRNRYWDPKTDPNRSALPDKFVFTLSNDQATISQQLISDADPNAITLDSNGALQASDTSRLNDPNVKSRTAGGLLGCTDVLNLNTEKITDPAVREAIALAIDRTALQVQYGGARFTQITNSYLNPAQVGYVKPNLAMNVNGSPSLDKAKALLKGKTYPKTLTYGYSDAVPRYKNIGTVLQQDLKPLGITLNMQSIPAANYYTTLATPDMPDIARAGWCGGANSGSVRTTVDPNLGPSLDGKTFGFSNISRWYDPTISKEMFQLRSKNGTSQQINAQWGALYNKAMATYPLIPLFRSYTDSVVGSNIRNAQVGYFFGSIDLSTVGLAK